MLWSTIIIIISEDPFIRELDDSHAGHTFAITILSAYIMNRNILTVMRIHFVHVIRRKPHLLDGTVMTRTGWSGSFSVGSCITENRALVEIPFRVVSHRMAGLTQIQEKHLEHKHLQQRMQHAFACELSMCKGHVWTFDLFVASKWCHVGSIIASENCHSCQ